MTSNKYCLISMNWLFISRSKMRPRTSSFDYNCGCWSKSCDFRSASYSVRNVRSNTSQSCPASRTAKARSLNPIGGTGSGMRAWLVLTSSRFISRDYVSAAQAGTGERRLRQSAPLSITQLMSRGKWHP